MATYNFDERSGRINVKKRGANLSMSVGHITKDQNLGDTYNIHYEHSVRGYIDKSKNVIGMNKRGQNVEIKVPESFINEIIRKAPNEF